MGLGLRYRVHGFWFGGLRLRDYAVLYWDYVGLYGDCVGLQGLCRVI